MRCCVKCYLGLLFSSSCKGMLVQMSHIGSERRAGFISLHQPSTQDFGGHFARRSVTDAHALSSVSSNIFLLFPIPEGTGEQPAFRHEVLLPSSSHLLALGVPWIFSCHHGGKWKQADGVIRGNWKVVMWYALCRLQAFKNWRKCV